MATGQDGRELNKVHPLLFQKLTYHTFLSGREDTQTFDLCSLWTKEPVVEGNDRLKESPTFINAEKTSSLCQPLCSLPPPPPPPLQSSWPVPLPSRTQVSPMQCLPFLAVSVSVRKQRNLFQKLSCSPDAQRKSCLGVSVPSHALARSK